MSKKSTKAAPKDAPTYEKRDIVLGKVRGFPPWPGMVVDPESVPKNVLDERPTKKANFYCVRFFPAGDFAWLVAKDISKLQTREIEAYINEPYKKSGDLLAGYRIALDPTKWEEERSKNIIYSPVSESEDDQVDELESEGGASKKSKSKKRKRDSEAGTAAKSKKSGKTKKDAGESTKKRGSSKGKNGPRSKAMVESEDEAEGEAEGEEENAGPSKKESPPPAKKAKRDKGDEEVDDAKLAQDPEALRVREWRHKLQKAFLGKAIPDAADMPAHDNLFKMVEAYDKMNIQYLQFSKIGKVMRHITVLPLEKVPRDDEFHFRDRAKALVDQWHQVLNANKPANGEDGANGKMEKEEAAVVKGAAAIDLNGKTEANDDAAAADADADAVGETSMGDITMMTDA